MAKSKRLTVRFKRQPKHVPLPKTIAKARIRIKKRLAQKKKEDRRGRHTKESRAKKQLEIQKFLADATATTICPNCYGTVFVPTSDSDSYACVVCGFVTNERIVDGACDFTQLPPGSPRYRHINYFAERIQQCRNREPRFTASEQNKINVVWSALHDQDRDAFSGSPKSFSKYRFRQICGILSELEPGRRWKQKLERWWQARVLLYGHDSDWNTPDDIHARLLKDLFVPLACWFELYFKREGEAHNIPKLDLIFLVLLYNISEESVRRYGWYFLTKNIVWPTKSTLQNYERIEKICAAVNTQINDKKTLARRNNVPLRAINWFHENQYTVPELDYLVELAIDSREGICTYNHLCTDGEINDKEINIVY